MPLQARTEFAAALNQLASEKGVDINVVVTAIEQAAIAAYKKDLSLRGEALPTEEESEKLQAVIDPVSGEISIMMDDKNVTPPGFARIAAQTAKQVILQRLHEAEKGAILDEYEKKVGTVISGIIQRQEGNTYFVDLGRAEGIMPYSEQIRGEYYYPHQRLKFLIKEIREGRRGPEVVLSRTEPGLVKGLFALEVPELQTGSVVIKDVAREAGSRSKVAVVSSQEGVDPVGSLVGQKGVRVQAVMNELGEERVDIIPYSEEMQRFIAASLSPAKDMLVTLEDKEEKLAKVKVPDSQLSLAIGKGGQNVRLAAKLTGWKIDIEGMGGVTEKGTAEAEKEAEATAVLQSQPTDDSPLSQDVRDLQNEAQEAHDREDVVEDIENQVTEAMAQESGAGVEEPTPNETSGSEFEQVEKDLDQEVKDEKQSAASEGKTSE